jgi:dTDP-4-dehydrorhamnose reductase
MIKVLILGATGMLGHALLGHLVTRKNLDVYATCRDLNDLTDVFPGQVTQKIRSAVTADSFDTVTRTFAEIKPEIVINCIGLIKQLPIANQPLAAISVNSQWPHRLALLCDAANARLVHISTDCVFDGKKGNYTEADSADATDLYGRTKFLGELSYAHCVTLRTSIIGHELKGGHGLIEWFLRQKEPVRGYTQAIFSGLPTIELAQIISDNIIPRPDIKGLYHVAAEPISKYKLLTLVAARYDKKIKILQDNTVDINRSLNSSRFRELTQYIPPTWPDLIDKMYQHYHTASCYEKIKHM